MNGVIEPSSSSELVEALRDAQRLGFFGAMPIERAIQHSRAFLPALRDLPSGALVYDLGSGGGLPGLVVAEARPDLYVTLIDRRQKRTDFLRRKSAALGLVNTEVHCVDVADMVREVVGGERVPSDAVTARGFGPQDVLIRFSSQLLRPSGRLVVSEPPEGDRWQDDVLSRHGLRRIDVGAHGGELARVQVLERFETD